MLCGSGFGAGAGLGVGLVFGAGLVLGVGLGLVGEGLCFLYGGEGGGGGAVAVVVDVGAIGQGFAPVTHRKGRIELDAFVKGGEGFDDVKAVIQIYSLLEVEQGAIVGAGDGHAVVAPAGEEGNGISRGVEGGEVGTAADGCPLFFEKEALPCCLPVWDEWAIVRKAF